MSDERLQRLAIDVDTRLTPLWLLVWEPGSALADAMSEAPALADIVGGLMRAAYGLGYQDALREDRDGRRGELARAHGYRHF